ncbi:1-deoxy-D-xylulose-5-phosphate reductoisomerase, partial [Curvivirga aplysinae]|uniref:1-deoxy-D-xylulose-5-phosphate reductoisomerase n=1 Tax=Curvivirga aplysinae TaxID=2529852 RepID=UPI0012BBC3AF
MKKSVSVLGATGSVGTSTMDLVRRNRNLYKVIALTANSNVEDLIKLAIEFSPEFVALGDESKFGLLKEALADTDVEVAAGRESIIQAAKLQSDWVMSSIMGSAGLEPTLCAIRRGAQVAFANKETLVCAGDLMMKEVHRADAKLLPVDSEHNAIYQVFETHQKQAIEKIHLTGSGGPFRTWPADDMKNASPKQAVNHPNWSMGAKISVDSATMMNKGLELIEACYLFEMPESKIDILVHPQSVIHSMVEYNDGSVLAQLGSPDMRTPIAYCLSWPNRMNAPVEQLDFVKLSRLDFEAPDYKKFPSLLLAREAVREGKGAPTILSAANEIAVDAFLKEQIGFLDIAKLVEDVLVRSSRYDLNSIEEVIDL